MSWLNCQIEAEPLYHRAELEFIQSRQYLKALDARVSQMPAQSASSISVPTQIALLRSDLDLPEAMDPERRLRILTILGMPEVNYDSRMARQTWSQVESPANQRGTICWLLVRSVSRAPSVTQIVIGTLNSWL